MNMKRLTNPTRSLIIIALLVLLLGPARAEGLPDLVCEPPRLSFEAGGQAVMSIPVVNRGPIETATQFEVRVGQRDDPGLEWVWETLRVGPLPAGGRVPIRFKLPLVPGTALLAVTLSLDPANLVPEADESNNELSLPALGDLVPPPRLEPVPIAVATGTAAIRGWTGAGWAVECLRAGEIAAKGTSDGDGRFALAVPIAPGANLFRLRAVAAGVWPGREAAVTIHGDPEPPVLSLMEPEENGSYRALVPRYAVSDGLPVQVQVTLDDKEISPDAAVEAPGRHTLRVTVRDAAGNATSAVRRFTIDRAPPALSVTGVADGQASAGPVRPALTARDENLRWANFWIDGYLWRNGLPVSAAGRHELTAMAEDLAGNRAQLRLVFTVSGSPPAQAAPGAAAIGAALPAGAKVLLARTGRLGPDPAPGAAVFFADQSGQVRLGLVAPAQGAAAKAWVAPPAFGPGTAAPPLGIEIADLDGDGAVEILGTGPSPPGRRLLIVRWQAGAWTVIADFTGESVLCFAGPAERPLPAVLVGNAGVTSVWLRTLARSGTGPQFAARQAPPAAPPLPAAAYDPGWSYLRPLLGPAPPVHNPGDPHWSAADLSLRARMRVGDLDFAILSRRDGYWPVLLSGDGAVPLGREILAGEIGPSWRWPHPDGLFACDFDGDGIAEPCLTARQGDTWRELRIYDLVGGDLRQVYRGRVRLADGGYDPGLQFIRHGNETFMIAGRDENTSILRWDKAAGTFQSWTGGDVPAGETIDLLGRQFLVKADFCPNLW
ncbi:MAG: CARDB domain-containing protein [Bacteroidota bacterium]